MKKEDLMIGDWVNIQTEKDDEPMYSQVEQLWECEIDADFETSYENVYPIPLTPEILEKNGFEKVSCDISYGTNFNVHKYDYIMTWCENYFICMKQARENCWNTHIQGDSANLDGGIGCIHELQHALKLCKIEKEIVL